MAENKPIPIRLEPVTKAYLRDLAETGAYGGTNRSAVMRRFIENGIVAALEAGVIKPKAIRDFGEELGEDDPDGSI